MKRVFDLYQYLGPALLTPLAAVLWWRHYDGNWQLVAITMLVPILHAYILPGIGTNVLGMWAFNTRLKIGKFRPHHGFVFGSATALLTLTCMGPPEPHISAVSTLSTAVLAGLVLLAVNWLYDALALKAGMLEVYNQPWADGAGPWVISGDYAVWFFGAFGVIYGAGLRVSESMLLTSPETATAATVAACMLALTLLLPTLGYIATSFLRFGHSGCRPVAPPVKEARVS
jgi:hypothetical protein